MIYPKVIFPQKFTIKVGSHQIEDREQDNHMRQLFPRLPKS